MLHTRNRTKVDWYPEHAFGMECYTSKQQVLTRYIVLLTLQKLVPLSEPISPDHGAPHARRRGTMLKRLSRYRSMRRTMEQHQDGEQSPLHQSSAYEDSQSVRESDETDEKQNIRTLHTYKGEPDRERGDFLKKRSMLTQYGLAVAVEQVSMFLCSDNTVLSFFEHSGDDIEDPILERFRSGQTILKRTSDASMMMHAIIDGIVDIAIPIIAAYEDAIADLEMDILIDPRIEHSQAL